MSEFEPTQPPAPRARKTGRRVAVVGTIAGLALIGGAGAAYAASQQAPVESGYSTVVDEATPGTDTPQAEGDCPDRAGNSNGSGSSGESAAPSSPQQGAPSSPQQGAPSSPQQSADPTPGEV